MRLGRIVLCLVASVQWIDSAWSQTSSSQKPVDAVPVAKPAPHSCRVNGCGPDGFFGALIPNEVAGCKFKPACDDHDICYTKCNVCHPFHTDPTCHGFDNKQKRRLACDTAFRSAMLAQNRSSRVCRWAAEAYYTAVRRFGENLHRGTTLPTDLDKAEFEKLFREEFERRKTSGST